MGLIKQAEAVKESVGTGRERYLGNTKNLMLVVIDFEDGPKSEPDPPHSHPHEQMSYVAAGEIIVHIGAEQSQLGPGDMFSVPPDVPHTVQLLTKHVRLVDAFTPIRDEFLS